MTSKSNSNTLFYLVAWLPIGGGILTFALLWLVNSPYMLPDYPHPVSLVGVVGNQYISFISNKSSESVVLQNGDDVCPPISRISQNTYLINSGHHFCDGTSPHKLNLDSMEYSYLGSGLRAVASPDGKTMYSVSKNGKSMPEFKAGCLLMKQAIDMPDNPPTALHGTYCWNNRTRKSAIPAVVFADNVILFTDRDGYLSEITASNEIRRIGDGNVRMLPVFADGSRYYGYSLKTLYTIDGNIFRQFDSTTNTITDYDLHEEHVIYLIHLDTAHNTLLYTNRCGCHPFRQCWCLFAFNLDTQKKYYIQESWIRGGTVW